MITKTAIITLVYNRHYLHDYKNRNYYSRTVDITCDESLFRNLPYCDCDALLCLFSRAVSERFSLNSTGESPR